MHCNVTCHSQYAVADLQGRVDSMTSPELQKILEECIAKGDRTIVCDFNAVEYLSSAGLRIFLIIQKKLKKAGGEIIILKASSRVYEIFKMSGFHDFFRFFSDDTELAQCLTMDEESSSSMKALSVESVSLKYLEQTAQKDRLLVIGSQEKLPLSAYTQNDVVTVKASDILFGTGLASTGNSYNDYKNYFGEAVILKNSLFFYPAMKRASVDFMIGSDRDSDIEYRFLHGFGFKGNYKYIFSFEADKELIEIAALVEAIFQVSSADLIGVVLLAESRSVWGMNLKKVPIAENSPENIKDIFATDNFSEWINFPLEPSGFNCVVAGTGIAVRNINSAPSEIESLFSKENPFHFHAGVFSEEPFNLSPQNFDSELKRIITTTEVHKVQHLLGRTNFKSGLAAVIELESSDIGFIK